MKRKPIYTGSAVLGRGAYADIETETAVEKADTVEAIPETAAKAPASHDEFRAKMKAQAMSSVAVERTGYPRESIFVVGTLVNGSGRREYRIGMLTHEDLQKHLFDPKCPKKFILHTPLAVRCFGKSDIYHDSQTAVSAAKERWPDAECGVKIVPFECAFPHSAAD